MSRIINTCNFLSAGYGQGGASQSVYGQVPQGPVPYAGPGPGPGAGQLVAGYSTYAQQAPLGPRMNSQGSAYSMYSASPMADSRMYPSMPHAAEQYPPGMHQNSAAAMGGWPGQMPPQGEDFLKVT